MYKFITLTDDKISFVREYFSNYNKKYKGKRIKVFLLDVMKSYIIFIGGGAGETINLLNSIFIKDKYEILKYSMRKNF